MMKSISGRAGGVPRIMLIALLAVTLMVTCGTAGAGLTAEQGRCRKAAASAAQKYFTSSAAAVASCHDAVGTGKLVASDCRLEPGTAAKIAKAAIKLGDKIAKSCDDATIASLRFGDDCDGVATRGGLTACLEAIQDREVDALASALYATPGAVSPAAGECRTTASKNTRSFAAVRMKTLASCKNLAAKDKLVPGSLCVEDPATIAKLDKKRAPIEGKIAPVCGPAVFADIDFGPPCLQAADGASLTACLLAQADDSGDAASLAAYGDGSFCGDAHQAVDGRIEVLLAQMSLSEKMEQMHGTSIVPQSGLWATPDNDDLGIPGFGMIDGPRGVSKVAGNATAFPVGIARGATWDEDLERRVGEAMGIEARAKGASVLLAPVTAVVRHPRWGRSQESYGEDPFHLGRMGIAFVRGAQRHVIASPKHFAMNSIEDTRLTVSINADERTMREIYLPHFRAVVEEADAASVMAAYNRVNGTYCAENPELLTDILKEDWGFRGFVESDWIFGMHSTIDSALAGLDIEMPFPQFYGSDLENAVTLGDVPMARIDESVRRILRAKLCFRLDTDPPAVNPSLVESPGHLALALETARKSIVLLKNSGTVLPLDRNTIGEIAVVGPLADLENIGDSGSSDVTPSSVVTPLEGLQSAAGPVTVTHVADPSSPVGQAAIAAADAAIAIVGFTELDEGEENAGAGDRVSYALPAAQEQLITDVAALNPSTIVVLEGGSAIGVEDWIGDVEALLMAWYPGMEGGKAIADIVFGDVNPSGKLPLVFAKLDSDLPPFENAQADVTYDYYHGYRLLDRDAVDPRYPFGFGLSYTSYAYGNLAIEQATLGAGDTLRVSFDVTNTGTVAGDEIAQLYVSYTGSAVDRPPLDLKGFARVELAPAETRTVTIEVPVESLAYWDIGTSGWVVEAITYGVHVGGSSRDLPLAASFDVQ